MDNDNQDSSQNLSSSENRAAPLGADFAKTESESTRFRLPAWTKALALVILVALASIGYFTNRFFQKPPPPDVEVVDTDPDEIARRPQLPDVTLTDASGQQKKLSDFRGNVVILSFWASWCAPCLVELPTFAELEKKYSDQGLRIVPVNVDEGDTGKNFATDFWKKNSFQFPSFIDSQKQVAQDFEVERLPSNFVIDRAGRLVFSSFGSNDWAASETTEFIEGLLAEK